MIAAVLCSFGARDASASWDRAVEAPIGIGASKIEPRGNVPSAGLSVLIASPLIPVIANQQDLVAPDAALGAPVGQKRDEGPALARAMAAHVTVLAQSDAEDPSGISGQRSEDELYDGTIGRNDLEVDPTAENKAFLLSLKQPQQFDPSLPLKDQAALVRADPRFSRAEKITEIAKLHFTSRILALPPAKRETAWAMLKNIDLEAKMDSPALNGRTGMIVFPESFQKELLTAFMALAHEFRHGIDRLTERSKKTLPLLGLLPLPTGSFRSMKVEPPAIADEWEILQLFTRAEIEEAASLLKKHRALREKEFLLARLANAQASKEEFVKRGMASSGYTYPRLIVEEMGIKISLWLMFFSILDVVFSVH